MSSYELLTEPPPLDGYLRLRADSGLSPKTPPQAEGALANSWRFCHVRDPGGQSVAMGRVIGDGGWYFHIADMATLPDHQGQGLGRMVLEYLLDQITEHAPPEPYITLMADPPGRRLYESLGFVPSDPSIGMKLPRNPR